MVITAASHPALFAAFELISHDTGRQAGHQNYAIPLEYTTHLTAIEGRLAELRTTVECDFETLCIGEEMEMEQVARAHGLEYSNTLLQRFFEEFE